MTIELYRGQKFANQHELEDFNSFYLDLNQNWPADEFCMVIAEADIKGADVDLLLLSAHAVVLVDFKRLTQASASRRTHISGRENGLWEYHSGDNSYKLGGIAAQHNPYQQLRRNRYCLADWFKTGDHAQELQDVFRNQPLDVINAWASLSPGFDGVTADIDLPWKEVRSWFRVLPLADLASSFQNIRKAHPLLSKKQMRDIAKCLGVTLCKDASECFDVPAAKRIFSTPPPLVELVGRDSECESLRAGWNNSQVFVFDIGGERGLGKTALARWLVELAQGYEVYWLNCAQHPALTINALLSAISVYIPLEWQGYLRDPNRYTGEQAPQIHLDSPAQVGLEWLAKRQTVLVLDDFHLIAKQPAIAEFVHLVFGHSGVRLILTTRQRFLPLDWSPGSYQQISLSPLLPEAFANFMRRLDRPFFRSLTDDVLYQICERLGGNPGVTRHLQSLIEDYARAGAISQLPLDQTADDWLKSFWDTVPPEALSVARQLAVIEVPFELELIRLLGKLPLPEAAQRARILTENYVLREASDAPNTFVFESLQRQFLYTQMQPKEEKATQREAGQAYENLAESLASPSSSLWLPYQLQAIHHLGLGGSHREILRVAMDVYSRLRSARHWEQAYEVAAQALEATWPRFQDKRLSAKEQQERCRWAIELAEIELYWGTALNKAKGHLEIARQLLPADRALKGEWQNLAVRCWKQCGRLNYRSGKTHYLEAREYIERMMAAAQSANLPRERAEGHIQIGHIERRDEHWAEAAEHFRAGLEIAQSEQVDNLIFSCLYHLGICARKQRRFSDAAKYYVQAHKVALRMNDQLAREISISHIGRLADQTGNLEQAEQWLRQALAIAREIGNRRGVRIELSRLINVLVQMPGSDLREIERLLIEADKLNQAAKDSIGLAWTEKHHGQVLRRRGDVGGGNERIKRGIELLRKEGYTEHIAEFEHLLLEQPLG